jgi:phospholipid/cholesterol/gamma-HCH transport system permease protein
MSAFSLEGGSVLAVRGPWTLAQAADLSAPLEELLVKTKPRTLILQADQLSALDTAGALVILRALERAGVALDAVEFRGMRDADRALLELVAERREHEQAVGTVEVGLRALVERAGAATLTIGRQTHELLAFVGLVLVTLAQVLIGRRRLRLTATVHHMEQTGLDAVPIVALLTFLVGAVVAFLGATVLADFGASIFTVELVAYSFLREFGVLLTAILLAGRSGSAFTAQIGSMKSREELDAIRTLGLDAIELLVIPRLLALLVMLPVLAFIAMLMGILGGGIVGVMVLDISPGMYLTRLNEMTEIRHFWVGMIKAPVFAFLIAIVGCLEGFKVEGSAESVGRHTTSSVVQAIFLVILFDALFAIFFMEIGL